MALKERVRAYRGVLGYNSKKNKNKRKRNKKLKKNKKELSNKKPKDKPISVRTISRTHIPRERVNIKEKMQNMENKKLEKNIEAQKRSNFTLKIIEDPNEIEIAQFIFIKTLYQNSEETIPVKLKGPFGNINAQVQWSNRFEIWIANRETKNNTRYWNAFGIERPKEDSKVNITCEINFPIKSTSKTAGAFAKDDLGNIYILHRGRIGGNYSKKDFESFYKGDWIYAQEGNKLNKFVMIGELNSSDLLEKVRDFVFDIDRIKRSKNNIK
jgi:hypothetical protein